MIKQTLLHNFPVISVKLTWNNLSILSRVLF